MIEDAVLSGDWFPLLRGDDLPEAQVRAVRLLGEDLVLWRAAGQVHAWQDLCIHRGTRLSLGKVLDENIVCPYHGWTYNSDGRCVHIPAHPEQMPPPKARARTYLACEAYGLIWVCPSDPPYSALPELQLAPGGEQTTVLSGPFTVKACATRIVENFLDVAHLPFVHTGVLGDPDHAHITDYQVVVDASGIVAKDVVVYQPDPYGTGSGDHVNYTYRVFRPLQACLSKVGKDGSFLAILLLLCPHDEGSTTAWFYSAYNANLGVSPSDFDRYQTQIFLQDRPIVESQRPELLPLDLAAELHLRSDRLAVAYRRWLERLGMKFGVTS